MKDIEYHESAGQRAVAEVARSGTLGERVGGHPSRHSFAILRLEAGYDIQTVQERLSTAS